MYWFYAFAVSPAPTFSQMDLMRDTFTILDGASILIILITAFARHPNNHGNCANYCYVEKLPPAAAVGVVQSSCACSHNGKQQHEIDQNGKSL